jgi:UDP-N-acetylmuramyl pentapeptide phosphotransferase/UDP-N-acetylglucosamine-1-phosphate transferase
MSYIFSFFILGIISIILSYFLTNLLIVLLPRYGMVDVPGVRRAHNKATPRGGGIAFIVIFTILLPLFEYYIFGSFNRSCTILEIFFPISLVSFWDDISHVMIPIRLLVHALCSFLAIMWLVHPNKLLGAEVPIYLDLIIASFALLTFLNLYNFHDGIDGITASETAHLSFTIIILCFLDYDIIPNVEMILIITTIILGWSIGFVHFNWQPAKIFLGDSGSITIGFLLGICLITIASASSKLFIASVIASLYYLADGGLTILIRLIKGEKIWEPHLDHFFQKSVRKGSSHEKVVKRIINCNLLLMAFSIGSLYYPIVSIIGALSTIAVTLSKSVY